MSTRLLGICMVPAVLACGDMSLAHLMAVAPFENMSLPNVSTLLPRIDSALRLAPYRLVTDSTITPVAAGQALHHLLLWTDSDREHLQSAPDSASNQWVDELPRENPLGIEPAMWCSDLLALAPRLTRQQEDFLRSVVSHPRDTLFLRFARAPHADRKPPGRGEACYGPPPA